MSYERQNSMSRLEQYRARQAERIEAMSRAIDEGRTIVVPSAPHAEETPPRRVQQRPVRPLRADIEIKRLDTGVWVGSCKSVTATSVETSFRQPIHVKGAAPIEQDGSQRAPKDGQLFSYDAESGQMIPVETQGRIVKPTGGIIRRTRRARPQHHVMGNVVLKVK